MGCMTAALRVLRAVRPVCHLHRCFKTSTSHSWPSRTGFSTRISTSARQSISYTSQKHSPKQECLAFSAASPATQRRPAAASCTSTGTVLPLCERPARATVSLAALLIWHKQAAAQAREVGSIYADADGGPTAEDLLVELNWLLDDAIAAMRSSEADDWQPATWQQLEPAGKQSSKPVDALTDSAHTVSLRADIAALAELWKQRIQHRVPLQYLNNCCHWRDLILAVGPAVLIPRPETELLVDFAQEAVRQRAGLAEGPWLDLGTGSGAIAIGLTTILPCPNTQVYAVDKSPEAVAWAQRNVQRLGLQNRVQARTGSWYSPVQHMQGQFAGIISNPPYIPSDEMPKLQVHAGQRGSKPSQELYTQNLGVPIAGAQIAVQRLRALTPLHRILLAEVGRHEPWLALEGGEQNGMDSLAPICCGASAMLQPGGFLALETAGGKQAEQVATLLKQLSSGFDNVQIKQDLAGVARFVTAHKCKI